MFTVMLMSLSLVSQYVYCHADESKYESMFVYCHAEEYKYGKAKKIKKILNCFSGHFF